MAQAPLPRVHGLTRRGWRDHLLRFEGGVVIVCALSLSAVAASGRPMYRKRPHCVTDKARYSLVAVNVCIIFHRTIFECVRINLRSCSHSCFLRKTAHNSLYCFFIHVEGLRQSPRIPCIQKTESGLPLLLLAWLRKHRLRDDM